MSIQESKMEELSIEQIEQVSGGDLVAAGFGTGLVTSTAIGFAFFGPVGAVGAAGAFFVGLALLINCVACSPNRATIQSWYNLKVNSQLTFPLP